MHLNLRVDIDSTISSVVEYGVSIENIVKQQHPQDVGQEASS
jgi:hypothetical protein